VTSFGASTGSDIAALAEAKDVRGRGGRRSKAAPYLFLLPALLFFSVFWVFPFLFSIWVSTTDWDILGNLSDLTYQGLENYGKVLNDSIFRTAVRNTFTYVLMDVPALTVLGLGLALLLKQSMVGRGAFRTIAFLPHGTSAVALAIIWKIIYMPADSGVLNGMLLQLGLPTLGWLTDPSWALPSILIMTIWKWTGFTLVVFLVALFNIPSEYYEAARVDGANVWHTFRHITIPLLRPTFLFTTVTNTIGAFQIFTEVYLMTEGGPAKATEVVVHYMYTVAFEWLKMGKASAMAILLLALILAFVLVEMRLLRARD